MRVRYLMNERENNEESATKTHNFEHISKNNNNLLTELGANKEQKYR